MLEITRISLSNMLPSLLAVVGLCALTAPLPEQSDRQGMEERREDFASHAKTTLKDNNHMG